MPNGIELIIADHERVSDLFLQFEANPDGNLVGQIIDALTAHDDAEHAALYPLLGHLVGDDDMIARAAAAHRAVKAQIDVLTHLEGAPLRDAVAVLAELVTAHVADEQDTMLPALEAAATDVQLEGLGARILQAKQRGG
jgi:hypothetical protein